MRLTECISRLQRARTLPELVEAGRHIGTTTGTDEEVKAAWENLKGHLSANDHRHAVATALGLLWLSPDDTVRRIRKDGLLRASRYGYTAACIRKVAGAALIVADELDLSHERREYLSSVLALTQLAGGAKQIEVGHAQHDQILARRLGNAGQRHRPQRRLTPMRQKDDFDIRNASVGQRVFQRRRVAEHGQRA